MKRGTPIAVVLVVQGDQHALFLNGHAAGHVVDRGSTLAGGIVLAAAADPSQPSAEVSYDDFRLWRLEGIAP